MLHVWNMHTYIYPKNHPNVGKYSSTMEHLGMDWFNSWEPESIVSCKLSLNPLKIGYKKTVPSTGCTGESVHHDPPKTALNLGYTPFSIPFSGTLYVSKLLVYACISYILKIFLRWQFFLSSFLPHFTW
jgi:hypothetical protein